MKIKNKKKTDNKKSVRIKKALFAAMGICLLMSVAAVPMAAREADNAPETAFVEGEVAIIPRGDVTPGYAPAGEKTKADTYDPAAQDGSEDDFKTLWDKWQDFGYPANVAGVTQDRYKVFGGEIMVEHNVNEYTVLVIDDSEAAIAEIRALYTEQNGVKVNFSRSCVSSSGETVEMKYSYGELSKMLGDILADIEGDDRFLACDCTVSGSVDVTSNRVEIVFGSKYFEEDPKADDDIGQLCDYYSQEYGDVAMVLRKINLYDSSRDESKYAKIEDAVATVPVNSPADIVSLVKNDHMFLKFFAVAASVAVITLGAAFVSHRRHEPAPVPADGDKNGREANIAGNVSERELLEMISKASSEPSDGLFSRIMTECGKDRAKDQNNKN